MKTIKLLLLIITLFVSTFTFAQLHDMSPGSTCKLIKTKVNTESHICPACAANDKKEKDAKIAEVKRRNDLLVTEAKAKNDAEQKAYRDKLAADKLKEGSGNVLINAQPIAVIEKNETTKVKKAENITNTTIMIGNNFPTYDKQIFKNEKNEVLLENNEWTSTYSISYFSMVENCPKNLGIVKIGDRNFYYKPLTYYFDIIDTKGTSLLNDKDVKAIAYLNEGWFLVGTFNYKNNYLFNFKTNDKIILENIASESYRNNIKGIIDTYLPVFSDEIKLHEDSTWDSPSSKTIGVKGFLSTIPNSNLNEAMLSKYSFVLVHTDYGQASYLDESRNYKPSAKVLLFCMTKDGKLETITLK